jgi:antitoxin component YwqK of YwqJK toxin-antitoxin module
VIIVVLAALPKHKEEPMNSKKIILLSLILIALSSTALFSAELKREYYKNGVLKSEWHEIHGEKDGVKKDYYADGTLSKEVTYVRGKPEGLARDFNPKGQVSYEAYFKDGKKDGTVRTFYESGQIFSEEEYNAGILDGISKRYYTGGTVQYLNVFKNGQKISTRAYEKNGTLKYSKIYPYAE